MVEGVCHMEESAHYIFQGPCEQNGVAGTQGRFPVIGGRG